MDVMQETEIIGQVDVGATVHQLWGRGGDCSIVMADATYPWVELGIRHTREFRRLGIVVGGRITAGRWRCVV